MDQSHKMSDKEVLEKFEKECREVVSSLGLETYAFDLNSPKNTELKIYIRRPETQSADLNDCIKVDRALTDCIDNAQWLSETFNLEVSSPGVYRKLSEINHFKEAKGERVKVQFKEKLTDKSGKKLGRSHIGVVTEVHEGSCEVEFNLESIKEYKVKIDDIKSANIEPNWDEISPST